MRFFQYKIIFCVLVVVGLFASCQKSPMYNPSMVATLGTASFVANGSTEAYCDSIADSTGLLHVHGYSYVFPPGTSVRPVILLEVPAKVGSYTIGQNCQATLVSAKSGTTPTKAVSGTITVSGIGELRIEGTFTFTCQDGEVVSNGQFLALYH